MTDDRRTEGRAKLEGVVDDVFGFDFKLPRTLRDLLFRPGRVADAALASDHSRYTRPLRVFLTLLAVQTIVYGWAGVYDSGSLAAMLGDDPARLAIAEARLAEAGATLAEADETVARWTGWSTGPVTTIASLFSVLVIWITRRQLGLIRALQLYMVGTNASSLVALPLMAGGTLTGTVGLMSAAAAAYVAYFAYLAAVLHTRAADTAVGLVLRVLALILAMIPIVIIVAIVQLAVVELGFRMDIGVWRAGVVIEAVVEAAQQAQ